jgi:prepilin-type N-terminal cleavage/methylation domain-containing protein
MHFQYRYNPRLYRKLSHGFTLLEVLIVVTLLALVGGAVIYSQGNVRKELGERLSDYESSTLYKALKQFRRDTGYYPKQGPFALLAQDGSIDPGNADHWPAFLSDKDAAERTKWFNHPANFYQLILGDSPLKSTEHALESFSIQTGRGWRGPYIKDGVVRIIVGDAEEYDPVADAHTPNTWTNSSWDAVGTPLVTDLVLLCDPFMGEISTFPVRKFGDKDNSTGLHGTTVGDEFGRPYMYFPTDSAVWFVGMGADRAYQGGNASSDDELVYLVE